MSEHPAEEARERSEERARRFREADRLFDAALDLAPHERATFLDGACAQDAALRAEIEQLLRAHDASAAFFDAPAVAFVAPVLSNADFVQPPAVVNPNLDRVGPFRIVREIGHGGMGTVYLAQRCDEQFEQRVALKVIRHSARPAFVQRFLEERRILAMLDHPRIARLVDGGVAPDGAPWFAMEYVDGAPIDKYCDMRCFSIAARLELFVDVCDAVQYAHQHFVVHRDLKPSNILITSDGQLKLLDFGVAKLVDPMRPPDDATTDSIIQAMTPEYAAPEQVRGSVATAATDVYALGVLLYALVTGRRPYEVRGRSPAQIERIVCELEPVRPSATLTPDHGTEDQRLERARGRSATPDRLRRALSGDIDTIVLKALRKEPEARYASAYELARDVRRHLSGHPVLARRQTKWYRARRYLKRHRIEAFATLGIGLSLIVGAAISIAQARNARAERDRAEEASREIEATNAFLIHLFEASDPGNGPGESPTARQLVQRAAARVDSLPSNPPEQLRLLLTVGQLYQNLGEYEQARSVIERAISLRRVSLGNSRNDDLDVASALAQLTTPLISLDRFQAADSAARRALATQERILGSNNPVIAPTLHQLASIAIYRGEIMAAEAYHRRALAIREHALGPDDSLTAASRLRLAATLRREGKTRDAEREIREGLATLERASRPDERQISGALQLLADLLGLDEHRYAEAEPLFRSELAIRKRVLGDSHPLTSHAEFDLAEFLDRKGDRPEAVALARHFLAATRRVYGTSHPVTADATAQTAWILYKAGRLAEAESLFRNAITMDLRLRGANNQNVAGVETSLARLLIDRHKYKAAGVALTDALRIDEALVGPEHPATGLVRGVIGLLLMREGRYAAADSTLRHAIRTEERQVGPAHPDLRELRGWLADVEDVQGHHADAARDRAMAGSRDDR